MKEYIIPKSKIPSFITFLSTKFVVIGPVEKNGVLLFEEVHEPKKIKLGVGNSTISPKSICLPQTETLFCFSTKQGTTLEQPEKPKKTVVVGIRPCDARSLHILDHVFRTDIEDPLVLEKLKNTWLIGITCEHPPHVNCFCTSVDGHPADTTGLDLLLTDIGDSYFVDVLTEKGTQLITGFDVCTIAKPSEKQHRDNVVHQAGEELKRSMNCTDIVPILDTTVYENKYWEDVAQKCIGCGICTFICPTCHCFDMQDETNDSKGARVRIWDSCMYPEYTKQASGYNPRPEQLQRVRNRIYHKFNYFPKNIHVFGCVGCGRCITECPVNIDIIEIINTVREVPRE